MKSVVPLLLFFILVGLSFAQKVDLTFEPKARGKDVVEAVVKKVRASRIFPEDNELLLRIAFAETKFGDSPNTYSGDSSGGIWKLDESALLETQNTAAHPWLTMAHYNIAGKFGIDWAAVTRADLLKPLYSGLAGRIFLRTLPEPIPGTIKEQAEFWKKYYHKTGTGTVDTFIADINEMQNNFKCKAPTDRCIVLDGSGSIAPDDFEKARGFVHNTIATYYSERSRFCLILYSTDVDTYFSLGDNMSKSAMLSIVEKLTQPQGMTNTRDAILKAVDIFNLHQRTGVPKNMLVLTDGQSNHPTPGVQPGPTNAVNSGIITFAWGIGPNTNQKELIEIANNDYNVSPLLSYAHLLESTYKYIKESCSLAQKPLMNTEVEDSLFQHEKRFYNFKVTSTGISVTIRQKSGRSIAYYSYTETNPSSALHDGQFSGFIFIPGPVVKRSVETNADESRVFIAVEGLEVDNYYTIFAQ